MKAHEKRLVFETIERIAKELEEIPAKAEAMSRAQVAKDLEAHPEYSREVHGHSVTGRIYPMELGAIKARVEYLSAELRALVLAFGPSKGKRVRA